MDKNIVSFKNLTGKNVKIFLIKKREPLTGKVELVHKKYLVLLQKKANKQENDFIYKTLSVQKHKIERIDII